MYGIYENGVIIAKFITPLSVTSNQPYVASDALSLKRTYNTRSAQRWEISAELEPLTHTANDLFALITVNGATTPFTINMPQNFGVIHNRTSVSVNTSATAAAYATSVSVTGNSGLIPRGTFIKFANHPKVYMTTAPLNGNGALGIYPPLRTSLANVKFNHRDDVFALFNMDTSVIRGMSYTDGIMMSLGKITLLETL